MTLWRNLYDANGNTDRQLDGAGKATLYAYDAQDRVVSVTDPLTRVTRLGYDAAGNRTALTDAAGQVTTYAYDVADQLVNMTYSDGTTANATFTYDSLGRRKSMTDGTGTSAYEFDSLGRLTKHTDGAGQVVAYGHDLKGQLTSLTYPGAKVVSRTFDDAGHLTAVKDWLGETSSFSYDANGNQSGGSSPNGTSSSVGFDAADRLMSISHTKETTSLATFDYTRTPGGQSIPPFRGGITCEEMPCQRNEGSTTLSSERAPCGSSERPESPSLRWPGTWGSTPAGELAEQGPARSRGEDRPRFGRRRLRAQAGA